MKFSDYYPCIQKEIKALHVPFCVLQSDCIVVEPKEEPVLSDTELNELLCEVSHFWPVI